MMKWIIEAAEWGVTPETPPSFARHYRLTNVLFAMMFCAATLQTSVLVLTGAYEAALVNCTAPLLFAFGLWLMKSGRTVLARVMVITVGCVASYSLLAALGPDTYFQFILLFASGFAAALFPVEQLGWLVFGLVMPLVCFITLELTHYQPVFGMSRPVFSSNQLILLRVVSCTMVWGLMLFHFVFFMRDRRRAQEQLVSAAKMVAVARMASGIAHEVNNPLQLIMSLAERLKITAERGRGSHEETIDVASQMQQVAMRIASINKGLLNLSRNASGDPMKSVSVRNVLDLSLEFSRAHLESQSVKVDVGEFPPALRVIGRETQLSEVVLNVLNNAYDAVSDLAQKWIRIDVAYDRDWVEIRIRDSGQGVAPEFRSRIFDPFFTTKPLGKGTGLGLSVSQSLMAAHGGQIYYDDKAPGACFVLRIPKDPKAPDGV